MVTLIILFALLLGFFVGLRRGLILQTIHLVGFIIALIVARMFYKDLGDKLEMWVPFPSSDDGTLTMLFDAVHLDAAFYNAIAFLLIFILVKFALQMIGSMLDFLAQLPLLKQINKLAGGALGFVQTYLGIFILLYIAAMLPIGTLQEWIQGSFLAEAIILDTPFLSNWVTDLWFNPLS
ncbi:membrane protein [Bacillus sp. FJAT-27916]|uniref:CvpA family protein n=1 Tax=Bacillus sp. FJAT-27916 TaxID=1679169 RepID=UPI000670DF5D|nr:CvpA family protein [Bacillus sp. FJAT-27916]KMY43549.1 membrane protein [Bacillus sp. FJAT-27916]